MMSKHGTLISEGNLKHDAKWGMLRNYSLY